MKSDCQFARGEVYTNIIDGSLLFVTHVVVFEDGYMVNFIGENGTFGSFDTNRVDLINILKPFKPPRDVSDELLETLKFVLLCIEHRTEGVFRNLRTYIRKTIKLASVMKGEL